MVFYNRFPGNILLGFLKIQAAETLRSDKFETYPHWNKYFRSSIFEKQNKKNKTKKKKKKKNPINRYHSLC